MYGLVLEGGGAKGAYQVGVAKALIESEIPIRAIVGSSIGSINGAMLCQGDLDLLQELWTNIHYSDILKGKEALLQEIAKDDSFVGKLKRINTLSAGLREGWDIGPLREMLHHYIDEEKLRKSPIRFGLVTTNFTDKKPNYLFIEDIPEGQVADYLLASSALPVFETQTIGGKTYLDGGFSDNLPFSMLDGTGLTPILIRIYGIGVIKPKFLQDVIEIAPQEDLGGILEFDPERTSYNMELGYFDGQRYTKKLQGSRYYFKPTPEKEALFYFLTPSTKEVRELLQAMGLPFEDQPWKTWLGPGVDKLGLWLTGDSKSYSDTLVALLEHHGPLQKIPRFSIYDTEHFMDLLGTHLPATLALPAEGPIDNLITKIKPEISQKRGETIRKVMNIMLRRRKYDPRAR